MRYITVPNIPKHHVRLAAVSKGAGDIICALKQEGIEVVSVMPLEELPAPVAEHSDLQILHLGGREILTVYGANYLNEQLINFGFNVCKSVTKLGERYPQDVSLNFLLLNKCCFGLSSAMTLQLSNYCNHAGLQIINSKQGYARCSVAVIGQNAAITSDPTLYNLLTAADVDTLHIGSGDILLHGYNTGFIGGCCGLIDSNRLAFTGSLENYKYGAQVLMFLDRHGITPVYLTDSKLLDIGGILPLMEDDM